MKPLTFLKAIAEKTWPVLFWLVCWMAAAKLLNQPILLVSPMQAAKRFFELAVTSDFWKSVAFSCSRILMGFLLSVLISLLLAIISHSFPTADKLLSPLVITVKSVPVASFVVIVLFWTSSRNLSVIISMLIAFPILYQSILNSLNHLDPKLREVGIVFRLPPLKQLRHIILPQIMPTLRTNLSIAIGLCFKSGIAAEIIGIPKGSVGEGLYQAKIYLNSADLFAWTLTIVLLTWLCEVLLKWILFSLERSCLKCR